jgi:hypothetical protein
VWYIPLKVNPLLRERHQIAIGLLQKLDLDNVVLELRGSDYLWRAWTPPVLAHNGHHVVKRGRVRVSAGK